VACEDIRCDCVLQTDKMCCVCALYPAGRCMGLVSCHAVVLCERPCTKQQARPEADGRGLPDVTASSAVTLACLFVLLPAQTAGQYHHSAATKGKGKGSFAPHSILFFGWQAVFEYPGIRSACFGTVSAQVCCAHELTRQGHGCDEGAAFTQPTHSCCQSKGRHCVL
jgi:hypothetical protein